MSYSDPNYFSIHAVERAMQVLEQFLIGRQQELGITELSERLEIPKASVYRLVATLESRNFLRRNPESGRYGLGIRLFELGSSIPYLKHLRVLTQPFLRELSEALDGVTHFSVLNGAHIVFIEKMEWNKTMALRSAVGRLAPIHCTASGKAILGFLPANQRDEIIRQIEWIRFTKRTLMTSGDLLHDLMGVQERGYAVDDGESQESCFCIAAPVYSRQPHVPAGAVSVSKPNKTT